MNAGIPTEQDLPMPPAFSFAVQAAPARHPSRWLKLAHDAENIGYDALLVPHHAGYGGPIAAVAAAGAATATLSVGTLMLAVDFYNPLVLTEELLTLERLLGDRLEVGLGAGWLRRDYEAASIPMAPAGTRLSRLAAFVRDLEPARSAGAGQRARLVLGGGGRRMLELAAAYADVVNLGVPMSAGVKDSVLGRDASVSAFAERVGWVAEVGRQLERRPQLQCLAFHTAIVNDARSYVKAELVAGFGLPPEEVIASPLVLVGTLDELCRKLEEHREQLSISYWVVKEPSMYDFAPIVNRLAGS